MRTELLGDRLQLLAVDRVESCWLVRIDVENCDQVAALSEDWNHDLGARGGITSDMTIECVDVADELGLESARRDSTNTAAEWNLQAPYRSLVGPYAQQVFVDDPVEAGPAGLRNRAVEKGGGGSHDGHIVIETSKQLSKLFGCSAIALMLGSFGHRGKCRERPALRSILQSVG